MKVNIKMSWLAVFILCFIYWSYLFFHTKMVIVFDSVDYENTGRLIYHNGWLNFFQTGPHREPLYPALIAASMALADFFSLDYQSVLKIFQLLLLFSTQILMIVLMRKINVREGIIQAAVFYFGVSPATINAAFSLYYEIMVFPFVPAAVLLAGSLWSDICRKRVFGYILSKSVLFGACFSLLALGRGIFQMVFYFSIFPFCAFAVYAVFKRWWTIFRRALIFILVASTILYSAVSFVKTMNLRYNGEYILCATHLNIFLASAYKRSQPVTPRILAAHIAMIPGRGVCGMFFSKQECDYAEWYGMDEFRFGEAGQKMASIPKNNQERKVLSLVLEKAMARPFQYAFFSIVEALKMPFWESTKIGFVSYPRFMSRLYDNLLMRFGLRLLFGLITMASFIFVTFSLLRMKFRYFSASGDQRCNMIVLFFAWLMIAVYTMLYSTCFVITRYALPIVSLYIVCISVTIDAVIRSDPAAGASGKTVNP